MHATRAYLDRAVAMLRAAGVDVWIFGGWAEELLGLCAPRTHVDVDLLHAADDFARVDALELDWIAAKRFRWKRAFMLDDIMVELLLVRRDDRGWFSEFERGRWDWPDDVVSDERALPIASAAAVTQYRRAHARTRAA